MLISGFFFLSTVTLVWGHGRLIEPPSRSSAWRFGFRTPINYNDHQLFCGGFHNQYDKQGGKCGVCGDPYQGPRENEAGGKYATGTIVRHYKMGQVIDIKVDITANHLGWFEFKLCPTNDATKAATEDCFDQYLLNLPDVRSTRIQIGSAVKVFSIKAQLPEGLTCSQCVLQWKYNAGNNWGVDKTERLACVGCGEQEQFYGCADISIS